MSALERARILRACSFVFLGVCFTFGFYSVFVSPHPLTHPTMSKPRSRTYGGPIHPTVRGWDHRGPIATRQRGSRQALCTWAAHVRASAGTGSNPGVGQHVRSASLPGENTRRTLWQVSERASIAGVRPGQLISQAVALCPSLTLLEPDPAHYDATQEELLEILSGLSPIVEPAGRGRIFVGMDGLGRLYGSPSRQVERVLHTLLKIFPRPLVAATRIGWAPGKFGAWVAAAGAGPGRAVIVPDQELPAFLNPCPVSVLPVDAVMTERLERLGIETLGDLVRFPSPALVGQFGPDGRRARAWATGERIDPVQPYYRPQPIRASMEFHTPVGQVDTLHGALDRLLERALARLERKGRSIQGVRLGARLEGGGSWALETILREPTSQRDRIAFTIRTRMALSPPLRAVEALMVEFFQFGPATSQNDLFGRAEANGREENGRELSEGAIPSSLREAVTELKLKLGFSPLYRVVEIDPWSRIPERRHALLNFDP